MLQLTLILGSLHYRRKKALKKYWEHRNCQSTVTEPFERNHWRKKIRERNSPSKTLSSHLLKSSRLELSLFWTRISWHLIWRWMLWKQKLIYLVKVSTGHDSICYKSFLAFASFCTYNYCTFSPYRIIHLRAGRGGWACTRTRIFPAFTF